MARKFVISGGPSTGKTDTINSLAKEFKVFYEVARETLKNKKFGEETQQEIFKKQLKQIKEAEDLKGIVFFDRGIPDALAYLEYGKFKIPEEFLEESRPEKTGYELIFFLDFVPYKNDEIRKESEKEAQIIHKTIYDIYSGLGYRIIEVPLMSVEKRVEFIKSFL